MLLQSPSNILGHVITLIAAQTLLVSTTVGVYAQPLDPIDKYCKLWDHQSVLKNGRIWIDGGQMILTQDRNDPSANKSLGINNKLYAISVEDGWNVTATDFGKMFTPYDKILNETANQTVPTRVRAAFFSGNVTDDNLYLYGGQTTDDSVSDSLYTFNTADFTWVEYTGHRVMGAPHRIPNGGAVVTAPELGLGIIIEGQIDSGISPSGQIFDNASFLVSGALTVDMATKNAFNLTGPFPDPARYATTRGAAAWIPNVGPNGIIVKFGGFVQGYPTEDFYNGERYFVDMSVVYVADASTITLDNKSDPTQLKWYSQQTTGDYPSPRASFCTVTVSAQDNSSHHVYLHGGRYQNSKFYDEIYVLSLPAFRWTKLYSGEGLRAFHTCHLVGGSKLISIGGTDGIQQEDVCEARIFAAAIYNLNDNTWSELYEPEYQPYEIPKNITTWLGGNAMGGATINKPLSGPADSEVAKLLSQSRDGNLNTPSNPPSSSPLLSNSGSHLSAGAIAGIAIACAFVAVVVCLGLIWRCKKVGCGSGRHRQTEEKDTRNGGRGASPVSSRLSHLSRSSFGSSRASYTNTTPSFNMPDIPSENMNRQEPLTK